MGKTNKPPVYRVDGGKCYSPQAVQAWGECMKRVPDPGVRKLPWENFRVTLPKRHRLPSTLWAPILALYWELCDKGAGESQEVGVILLRSDNEPHERWRVLVPKQTVNATALTYDLTAMRDLVTGEPVSGIPDGWLHAGTSHSHNEMAAFFSSTDNRDELRIPGMHVVVGRIDKQEMTYTYRASVVEGGERYELDDGSQLIDLTPNAKCWAFHKSCLELVDRRSRVVYQLDNAPAKIERRERRELDRSDLVKRWDFIPDRGKTAPTAPRFPGGWDTLETSGFGRNFSDKGQGLLDFASSANTSEPMSDGEFDACLPLLQGRIYRLTLEQVHEVFELLAQREYELETGQERELEKLEKGDDAK